MTTKKSLSDYVVNTFTHDCIKSGFTDKQNPIRLGAWNYIKLVKAPLGVDIYFSAQMSFNGARILNDSNRGEKIISENDDGEFKTYQNLFIWIINNGFSTTATESKVVIEYSGENVKIEPLLGNTFALSKIDNISGIDRQAGVNYVYPANNQLAITELLTYQQSISGANNIKIDNLNKQILAKEAEIKNLQSKESTRLNVTVNNIFLSARDYASVIHIDEHYASYKQIYSIIGENITLLKKEFTSQSAWNMAYLDPREFLKPVTSGLFVNNLFSMFYSGKYQASNNTNPKIIFMDCINSETKTLLSKMKVPYFFNKEFTFLAGDKKWQKMDDGSFAKWTLEIRIADMSGDTDSFIEDTGAVRGIQFFINIGEKQNNSDTQISALKAEIEALKAEIADIEKLSGSGFTKLTKKETSNNIAFSANTLLFNTIKQNNSATLAQSNLNYILVNFMNKTTQNLTIKASAIIANSIKMDEQNAHIVKLESVNNATATKLKAMINALNNSDTITEDNIPKSIIFSNFAKIGKLEYDSETLIESIVQSGESQVVSGDTIITIPAYANMWLFMSDYVFASSNANEHKCAIIADTRIDIKIIGVENGSN